MNYTVYADRAQAVSKELNKLVAKAAKYGTPFTYEMGSEHPQEIGVYEKGQLDWEQVSTKVVPAVDFSIHATGLIKLNGWTVLAKIDHGENGNEVTPFEESDFDEAWLTVAPHCDHCNSNRARKTTYFVRNESGEIKQVGSSCLKDYTGINPMSIAVWASVKDIFLHEEMHANRVKAPVEEMLKTELVLAHASDVVREYGYVKAKDDSGYPNENSTKAMVLARLDSEPTEEGKAEAAAMIEWLINKDTEYLRELESKAVTLAITGYVKVREIGILAYQPVAYAKYLEELPEIDEYEARRTTSNFVGTVGQRITVKVHSAKLESETRGYYGSTYYYLFVDTDGNEYSWKTNKEIDVESVTELKGTVKEHKDYGIKTTELTRCKVAA